MSSSSSISLAVAGASIVGFFTFFTPFLIHYVTKKYVTEIIYDPAKEEYIATVFNFFLTKRQVILFLTFLQKTSIILMF